jgi:cytoskeletal protein CcmA (bactofilin family)
MIGRQDRNEKEIPREEIIALMGRGTEFKGVITYRQGTIRIDGRVEGEIITQGTLIVGETAEIHAEINAGTVISSGRIVGNVTAHEKTQLLPTAVLEGAIKTPVLIMEEGVTFNGQCAMNLAAKPSSQEPVATSAGADKKSQPG